MEKSSNIRIVPEELPFQDVAVLENPPPFEVVLAHHTAVLRPIRRSKQFHARLRHGEAQVELVPSVAERVLVSPDMLVVAVRIVVHLKSEAEWFHEIRFFQQNLAAFEFPFVTRVESEHLPDPVVGG